MSEAPNKHKKNEGNHDGCGDCLREKRENQAFINIYQRLQVVESKTIRLRQAVQVHRDGSETNRSFYRSYREKVSSLPKMQKDNPEIGANAGFEVALGVIEKEVRTKAGEENARLKRVIARMQEEILTQRSIIDEKKKSTPNRPAVDLSPTIEPQTQFKQSSSELMTSSQDLSEICQEDITTTKSSSFNISRNSMNLSKYTDLNLWLYQSEKNTKLEEELYVARQIKNRSFVAKRTTPILPNISRKK